MVDTSRIHSLISRARTRLKLQNALETATLAAIPALAAITVIVFAYRMEWLGGDTALALVLSAAGLVVVAGGIGLLRRFPQHLVAERIDRASGLSDRIGTACAFEAALATGSDDDPDTHAMMEAAIRDAVTYAPRADVKAATPYSAPEDLPAAGAFAFVAVALAFLWWHHPNPASEFVTAGHVTLDGAALPDQDGERGALIFHNTHTDKKTRIGLGEKGAFRYQETLRGGPYKVSYQPNATLCDGPVADRKTAMPCVAAPVIPFFSIGAETRSITMNYQLECGADSCSLDIDIKRKIDDPADLEQDDLEYISELLNELRRTAVDDEDPGLKEFVERIDDLLAKVERGELTKEQLLDEMRKAEERFADGDDPMMDEAMADLQKTGKELKKNKETKELGKALEKGDLDKAEQEMDKLAKKLDEGKMSEKERKNLAKALEKAAEKFDRRENKREQDLDKKIAKQQKQIRKMQRKLDQEKDPQQRQKMSRRLQKQKRDLKKLERKKQQRQQSQSKRNLKQLHRNMKQAAENMRSKNQKQQKQASRRMRDMQRNTGKVNADRRKIRTQKKVASQMEDLKEAMRRAKRRGNRGPRDLFGKNRKRRDFGRRARGLKGNRGAWKPGQKGKGKGMGQGQGKGGKGNQPGGKQWGDGHDPNLMDQATAKSGNTKDESVSGVHGKGPSVRETILSSAQKGFSSRTYKQVYARYKTIVEEVMQTEKVPSGYRNYIKRYFKNIKPHSMD